MIALFSFSSCTYTDSVIKTLPEYTYSEEYYSDGARDYTDYCKYYYSNNDILESIETNDRFQKVTFENIDTVKNYIRNYNNRIKDSKNNDKYDFSINQISEDNYFYFISKNESNPLNDYDLYYFDKDKQVLYYFHSNI